MKASTHIKLLAAGSILLFGRYLASTALSSKKRKGGLGRFKRVKSQHITCTSGNDWYAEFDGPEDAQPVVIIHGLQSTRLQWYYQQEHLRKNYRLVLLDLPGHGRSGAALTLSLPTLASDLKQVLQELSLENPILYGHSIGGMILQVYCIKYNRKESGRESNHPKDAGDVNSDGTVRIKGIVVHNSSYTNPLKTCLLPDFMRLIEAPVAIPYLNYVKAHPLAFRLMSRFNFGTGLSVVFYRFLLFAGVQSSKELDQICRAAAICPPEVAADGVLQTFKMNAGRSLHKINTPCLVIGAENDRIVRPKTAVYIASQVQNGKAVILPGGHMNLIEYPNLVNKALTDFFKELV
jgi:pimeloyl-ACP methyl ester carboxylesterase